jgi:hypothetical protein
MTAAKNRVRLAVEHMEDRCTPSTLGSGLATPSPAHHGGPHAGAAARVRAAHGHVVPITLTTHCFGDIRSLTARSKGFGTGGVGRYTGLGHLDNSAIDPAADRAVSSGTLTVFTAKGDRLFVSFRTSWRLSTGKGTHSVTVTGGTGRFAGASGRASLRCTITADLASQTYTCKGKGSGALILAHS